MQRSLFDEDPPPERDDSAHCGDVEEYQDTPDDLAPYDWIIVAFSGGKDSVACLLHLLEAGVDPTRIELWHHLVDGREGSPTGKRGLMDWDCTEDYCRKVARHFGCRIYDFRSGLASAGSPSALAVEGMHPSSW